MTIFNYKERLADLMNGGHKNILKVKSGQSEELAALTFFERVYGFNDLKLNLYSALTSDEQTNTLLYGPPACAKSLFMKIIEEQTNDAFYYDATNSTSAGLIGELYKHQEAKIILLDEIGMLHRNDLDALRGLLNDGRIIKTLKIIKYDFTMKDIKIFATTNDMDLPAPIKSRFMTYQIPEYLEEDFIKVSQFCLADKFMPETAAMIASVLLANRIKDIRQVINASRLVKKNNTEEEIVRKIETMIKYKQSSDVDYN